MTKQDQDAAAAAEKIAAKEAKLAAEIAKADKKAAAEIAKAEKAAAAEIAKAEKAKAAADAKAAKAAEVAAAKEAKAKARAEAGEGKKLGDLVERAKTVYVKGANGQLHSGDELATALADVPADKIVPLIVGLFNEPNKYAHLNYGQQSMNYRNRLRGAIRKGLEVNGTPMTLARVIEARATLS